MEDDATVRWAAVHNLTGSYVLWRLEVIGRQLWRGQEEPGPIVYPQTWGLVS